MHAEHVRRTRNPPRVGMETWQLVHLGHLTYHCPCHQTPHHVAGHDAPDASSVLPECCHPSLSNHGDYCRRNVGPGKLLPRTTNDCRSQNRGGGRKCSFVIPDGPTAAPFLDERNVRKKSISSNSNLCGAMFVMSSGIGSLRTSGSRNSRRVNSLPGATSAP